MESVNILTESEIAQQIKELPGWVYKDNKISKECKFTDFMGSVNFINALAPFCESIDHHPDIHIFYNKVLFELQRFDVGGKVTDKDFMVAHQIEKLYKNK